MALAVLLFVEHFAFGTNQTRSAVGVSALHMTLLAVVLWRSPPPGRLLDRLRPVIAVFCCLILFLCLTLWLPGQGNVARTWHSTGQQGSALTLDRFATLTELLKLVGLAAICGLGTLIGLSFSKTRTFLNSVTVLGGLYALFSIVSFFADPNSVLGIPKAYHEGRLTGTFASANVAATVFGSLAVLQLSSLFSSLDRVAPNARIASLSFLNLSLWGAIRVLTLAVTSIALVLTGSRAGISITLAMMVLVGFTAAQTAQSTKKGLNYVAVASIAGLAALVLISVMISPAINRFVGGTDEITNRSLIFSEHFKAFLQSPLTGWGLGTFRLINIQLTRPETVDAFWSLAAAHNVVLQWLEETGIVGAALMLATIFSLLWAGRESLNKKRATSAQALGILAASLLVMVHSMSDYALQVPSVAAMWAALLGILVGLAESGSERRRA
jgi:O-antigen ligase